MAREARTTTRERVSDQPRVPRSADPQVRSAIALLRSWQDGDAEEQRDTWEFLKQALDEDRPSYRKLFP
ncbi:MAG: hypothetical protein FJX75_18020 [Armatimonadetes bacterium]|nr:hypothetical protein [Armatimonadota bacterium]